MGSYQTFLLGRSEDPIVLINPCLALPLDTSLVPQGDGIWMNAFRFVHVEDAPAKRRVASP